MFGSELLEVAIGIIFIYLLVSILCSAVREGIEALLKTRSAYLEHGIRELLHDRDGKGLAASLYNHPLVHGLYLDDYRPRDPAKPPRWLPWAKANRPPLLARGSGLPSYIPSKTFALALMDLAARGRATDGLSSGPGSPTISVESIRNNVQNLGNEAVQRALLAALDAAQNDLNRIQENLAAWYDTAMDRVSGWYKRSTQWVILWVGLAVAVAFNVNTITIADYLYKNDAAREALVARAEAAARDTTLAGSASGDYDRARAALDSLGLPIGWTGASIVPADVDGFWETGGFWVLTFLGWLMTGLAATMGAPFWFDVLNKVMVIRSTVKPKEKSPEEASEDRQLAGRQTVAEQPPAPPPTRVEGQPPEGQATAPPAPPVPPEAVQDPGDAESAVDACDLEIEDVTLDEELPPARGGVALQ